MNAGTEESLRIPKSSERSVKELSKMPKIFGDAICNASLEMVPDKFVGVKLRRVSREVKGLDSRIASQDLPNKFGPVERAFVPEKEEFAGKVTSKVLNKLCDLRGSNIFVGVEAGVESETFSFGRDGDGRDGRDFSPASCDGKPRSSALRRPRFLEIRDKRESALVEEDQAGPKPSGLFLYGARRVVSNTGFLFPVFPWLSWSAPDNSSPGRPSDTKGLKGNTSPETSCARLSRFASMSKRLSENRLPGGLLPRYVPKPSSVCRRGATVFRAGVSALSLSIPPCGRLAANAPESLSRRPLFRLRLRRYGLVSKAGRLGAAGFPTVGVCHEVSLSPPGLPLYDRLELLSIER